MPWTAADATRHTSKAKTPALAHLWAKVANTVLRQAGDEVTAIRKANYAVARATGATRHSDDVKRKLARSVKAGRKAGWLRFI